MTNVLRIVVVVCACVALAMAQFDYGAFDDAYLSSFGGSNLMNVLSAAARDPRGNTGPVLFPSSPPGDPSQTSGVVVGASGYGFVPPNSQGPAVPRFFYHGFYLRR